MINSGIGYKCTVLLISSLFPIQILTGTGLPPTTAAANTRDDEAVVFLGGWSTPSGIEPDTNAYILNLKTKTTTAATTTTTTASISLNGGYLDGLALEACDRRRLDANPSAVAHLVNHSTTNDNVEVVAFDWSSVLPMKNDDNDDTKKDNTRRKGVVGVGGEDEYYYGLPNVARFDGAPRYMDGSEVVHYQKKVEVEHSDCQNVCGAVFCASVDIEAGEELFLDYGLVPPIPSWAVDFYD